MRRNTLVQGLHVESVDYSEDPFENLLQYARNNLEAEERALIERYSADIRDDIAQNRPVRLKSSHIRAAISENQRESLGALIGDIPIQFLMWRYDMLRRTAGPRGTVADRDRLLEQYWLQGPWQVDPEMPHCVARVIVATLSQWDLMCLLHDKLATMAPRLPHVNGGAPASAQTNLRRLGRLIAFLKWVPYNWVEEILLEMHDFVNPETKVDRLRLWVSVFRALFARPLVQPRTVYAICEEILDHFGVIPGDLQRYMQAILVSGGKESWQFIAARADALPERFVDGFFLGCMANIDKQATARFVSERASRIERLLEDDQILKLTESIGECTEWAAGALKAIWDRGDETQREAILSVAREHRWTALCEFLCRRFETEARLSLQMQMLEAIIGMGEFERSLRLLIMCERMHPALYYHAVELCYHRLLEHPAMLIRFNDLTALAHFERARQRLYAIYRYVFQLHHVCKRLAADAEAADADARSLAQEYAAASSALGASAASVHSPGSELAALFDYIAKARPRVTHNVLGHGREVFGELRLLETEHFEPPAAVDRNAFARGISDRAKRAEKSLEILRECYLFKEWFIRKAPFVLHEEMPALLESIRGGRDLRFTPDLLAGKQAREHLAGTLAIFYECTKQGVYLTDSLLERLNEIPRNRLHAYIERHLTHRRAMITRGAIEYDFSNAFDRHLQFTTFAHIYRYGKESMNRPPIVYLWLRFLEATDEAKRRRFMAGQWPTLPVHPHMQTIVGPRLAYMYRQQIEESRECFSFISAVFDKAHAEGRRIRVIPNITYGLFCLAPVMADMHRKGIHVSLAGMSSRFCDDINISDYSFRRQALFPVKPYLFSTASNYGTLNHDRVLIVIDGTMEPVDRLDPHKLRLPKAHRGFINHMAAVNYIRSRYGYEMEHPERDVASALGLSEHYVHNLIRTPNFKQLVDNLLLSFDSDELAAFQRRAGTGKTYYGFAQWNPDRRPVLLGSRGDAPVEVPCVQPENVRAPLLVFMSMNGIFSPGAIPAYFDNSPEVERPRIILGPNGVWLDTGWPHSGKGIVIEFPEGENQ